MDKLRQQMDEMRQGMTAQAENVEAQGRRLEEYAQRHAAQQEQINDRDRVIRELRQELNRNQRRNTSAGNGSEPPDAQESPPTGRRNPSSRKVPALTASRRPTGLVRTLPRAERELPL